MKLECKECGGKGHHDIENKIVQAPTYRAVWLRYGLGQTKWKCEICNKETDAGKAQLYDNQGRGTKKLVALDTICNDCKKEELN